MRRGTKIAGAVMAATLFASLFVGSSLALYNSSKTVNNHIKSGNMHAMLYLTKLQNDVLKNDGTINEGVVTDLTTYAGYDATEEAVNLAVYADEIFQCERVVPTMEGKADFKILNTGDVAFSFNIEIINKKGWVWDESENDFVEDASAALLDQLEITLVDATYNNNPVLANSSHAFSVKYLFKNLDGEVNNDAMDQKVTFDVSVSCTQVYKA